jgi:prevent-host-death family protein
MKKMPAGEFKTHCFAVMEKVRETWEPVLITRRGRPVAKLVPVKEKSSKFLGRLQGVVKILGDIESPIVPAKKWQELR